MWEGRGPGVMEIIIDIKDLLIMFRPVEGVISADSSVSILQYCQFYHTLIYVIIDCKPGEPQSSMQHPSKLGKLPLFGLSLSPHSSPLPGLPRHANGTRTWCNSKAFICESSAIIQANALVV